ncbi:MAG: permease [Bdellovibrio sp.]|nr:permease [Bdellovibrio sp.]
MGNDYVRIGDVRAMAVKDKKCCLTKPFAKQLCEEIMSSTSLVLKFMLLAFFLEALIILYIPQTWIMTLLGKQNALSVLWAAILGVPIYTSNTTALPMIGGLLNQGMNPAAALAFLISGPTTTIPAMAAVWGLVTKKVFFLYLSFVFCGAIFFGYLFQLINKFLVFV